MGRINGTPTEVDILPFVLGDQHIAYQQQVEIQITISGSL